MIKKSGYIAVLDVLGFSERIARESDPGRGLDAYIDTVANTVAPHEGLGRILFSDTVVLFSFGDDSESFRQLSLVASRLLYSLIESEVPVRGAIAHGDFARSDGAGSGTVLAGRPIVEAHNYEAIQQWIGIMLAPSALRKLGPLADVTAVTGRENHETETSYFVRCLNACRIQPCPRIPIQASGGAAASTLEGYALVPMNPEVRTTGDIKESLAKSIDRLRWLKYLAPDSRSQSKYQNSIDWLSGLLTDWTSRIR